MVRWTVKLKGSSTYFRYVYYPEFKQWVNHSGRTFIQEGGKFVNALESILDKVPYEDFHYKMTMGKDPLEELDEYIEERKTEKYIMYHAHQLGFTEVRPNVWYDVDGNEWWWTRYGFEKKVDVMFKSDRKEIKQVYRKKRDV